MALKKFFHGSGNIVLKEQVLSLRLIKEVLERKFTLSILEETSRGLRCKVVRFARLYAAPVLFPNPLLELTFENESSESIVSFSIAFYDYYTAGIAPLIFGILTAVIRWEDGLTYAIRQGTVVSITAFLFFSTLVFIDSKLFTHRIKRALSTLKKLDMELQKR